MWIRTMTALAAETEKNETPLIAAIRAARAGDADAFDEIMIATERRIAQIAWRILADPEEVKDAVQETFLRLYRHLSRYDEKQDFHAWLTRIGVNVCRDQLRRRKRDYVLRPIEDAGEVAGRGVRADDDLMRRADVALLREAIDSLPPKERLAIILRDVEGLPTEEVATALGNTVATVRVQLSRARVKLREFVQRKLQ